MQLAVKLCEERNNVLLMSGRSWFMAVSSGMGMVSGIWCAGIVGILIMVGGVISNWVRIFTYRKEML